MKYIDSSRDTFHIRQLEGIEHSSMDTSYYGLMWHKARNEIVTSKYGSKWIDFTAAIAIANAGHSNPAIIRAIKKSFSNPLLSTYHFPHRYRLQLSKVVQNLFRDSTNGQEYMTHFMSSGTEAVEAAIVMAKDVKRKKNPIIISFFNSFHGNTQQSHAVSGQKGHSIFVDAFGVTTHYLQLPYYHRQQNYSGEFAEDLSETLARYKLKKSDIAAILIEPYQGKGVYIANDSFMADVAYFSEKQGAVLIFDEIQSGFYRTGYRFAFEYFKVSPDIICIGKGLTSSLPMSGIAIKKQLVRANSEVDIATTHSANPLSCVAAIANIGYLESNAFQSNFSRTIDAYEDGLRALAVKHPEVVGYVEVIGMVASFHIVDKNRASAVRAKTIAQLCYKNGLIISMPNGKTASFLRFTPPLTIRKKSLVRAFAILDKALSEVES